MGDLKLCAASLDGTPLRPANADPDNDHVVIVTRSGVT